jgi:2-polyprenyl-3-methyl-5-hydroxy-6-metoxy-1,4-benzoquinol methylase
VKKKLPNPDVSSCDFFSLPTEALKWELLKTALEIKLFDFLTEAATIESVAEEFSCHGENTEYFLNALVGMGCLSKKKNLFQNTKPADTFLLSDRETFLGEAVLFDGKWNESLLNGGMKKLLKEGPPPPGPIESEALWEKAARVSLNRSRCSRAQRTAEYVSSLPEFSGFNRILDMGAGPGIMGISVTAAHETATCVVFDQPAVCKVADETIAEYGMEGRVATKCGDYVNDAIGTGYEFVMANYTLNFYRNRLSEIMTKVYQALTPGGIFMVSSDGLNKDKTAPAKMVLGWLSMSMQGMDMSFTRGEIADAMLRAGFVSTQSEMVDIKLEPYGPIDIIIGRKGRS